MFVVRIEVDETKTDFKAFEKRPPAESRFWGAARRVWDRDFSGAALFEVDAADARAAVDAVKAGDKHRVRLLEREPQEIKVESFPDLEALFDADRT